MAWIPTNLVDSGLYPKNSFKGILKAIYPTFSDAMNGYVLQLEFEEGQIYSVPIFSKDGKKGLHPDGTVDRHMAIGKLITSIENIDTATGKVNMNNNDHNIVRLKTAWGWMDDNPAGFLVYPENQDPEQCENVLIGCTLSNIATPREIGDTEQTAKAAKWPDWTIGEIEGLKTSIPKSTKSAGNKPGATNKPAPKPSASTPPEASEDTGLSDLILAALEKAAKEGKKLGLTDIFKALPNKPDKTRYKVAEIRKCITEDLEGAVIQNGEKYEVA